MITFDCAALPALGRLLHAARRLAAAAPVAPSPSASGSSAADSAWKAWTDCLPQWTSSTLNKPSGNATDTSALAAAVKAAAAAYKPKPTLKVPSLDDLPEVPKNLHKRLGACCRLRFCSSTSRGNAMYQRDVQEMFTCLGGVGDISGVCMHARGGFCQRCLWLPWWQVQNCHAASSTSPLPPAPHH